MDLKSFPEDKENEVDSLLKVEHALYDSAFMSRTPLIVPPRKLLNIPNTFGGNHSFKAWVPDPYTNKLNHRSSPYIIVDSGSSQRVFVSLSRSWPLKIAFKPSVTPVDFWLRITPYFVDSDRSCDAVERCKKHESKPSSTDPSLRNRSFVEVVNIHADYVQGSTLPCCPKEQITVCFSLDVLQLLESNKSENTVSDNSQLSFLPEVQTTIFCRLHCYNSCLGSNNRGEIELLLTLESKNDYATGHLEEYTILGLSKLSVRCCSCPSRDSKQSATSLGMTKSSSSSLVNRNINPDCGKIADSRRLSLNLNGIRNIRRTSDCQRRSYPGGSHQISESLDTDFSSNQSIPSVVINDRVYYLSLTDDLSVLNQTRNLRTSNSVLSGRWRNTNFASLPQKVVKFYERREFYIAECAARGMPFINPEAFFSQSSQSSSNGGPMNNQCVDKSVGTED